MNSLKYQDWFLNAAIILLALCSLLIIFSAAPSLFWQQTVWFAIAFTIIFLFSKLNWRIIVNYRWIIFGFYFFTVLLLLTTLFLAPVIRQSRSWLVLGSSQFQPSELAKVSLIILLSYFFAKRHIGIAHFRNIAISFLYAVIPAFIVFRQPDWGSALVLVGLWVGFLLVSGIRWRHLAIGVIILIIFAVLSWNFLLKDYQKERIVGFLQPSHDPLGVNYNVIQAKIAIGSSGFFGKGFRQGTQTQLKFLPESNSDFIFAAFTEEWGLVGGLMIVLLFMMVIMRIVKIGLKSENNFSKLICLSTAILFLLEFSLNVGSNLGFSPVVGVTFPFFSYGGSSLLTKALLISIIQNSAIRIRA